MRQMQKGEEMKIQRKLKTYKLSQQEINSIKNELGLQTPPPELYEHERNIIEGECKLEVFLTGKGGKK